MLQETEKVLIVNTDKCTGCRVCELACSMAKAAEYNPEKALIRVLRNKDMDLNLATLNAACDFCNKCVEACLPGAIEFVDFKEAVLNWKATRVGRLPAPLFSRQS